MLTLRPAGGSGWLEAGQDEVSRRLQEGAFPQGIKDENSRGNVRELANKRKGDEPTPFMPEAEAQKRCFLLPALVSSRSYMAALREARPKCTSC